MRNINLNESISKIQDIAMDMEGLMSVDMNEVQSLINKGFCSEESKEIISILEYIKGEILNISEEMKSIN
jgi:hypothetical protein